MSTLGTIWNWIAIAILLVPWGRCGCSCHDSGRNGETEQLRGVTIKDSVRTHPELSAASGKSLHGCHCDEHRAQQTPGLPADKALGKCAARGVQDTSGRRLPTPQPEPGSTSARSRGSPAHVITRQLSILRSTVLQL